jgi:lycopene beta-cyclase
VTVDLLLVGAGLASSLIALRVSEARPGARIRLLEQAGGPSETHTWSFHETDLSPAWHRRLAPGLRAHWDGQEVRFADHARSLRAGYAALDDGGLARLLAAAPGVEVSWGTTVASIDATGATLEDGTRVEAPCVVDGRGAAPSRHLVAGWQKFLGIELETEAPHGVLRPVIMDATVPQVDGFRFVYLLPFSPTRLLVEDTRYSDDPRLDEAAVADAVRAYAAGHGWRGAEVRRERAVLPIALAHDAVAFWAEAAGGAVPVGVRAELFHPVTGYSLPVAARLADVVAAGPLVTAATFADARDFALAKAREDRFLRLLSRMLFRGCPPEARHRVLSRFYRLPEPLIERFYAGRLTALDRVRIVSGKPPIPLRDALPCLREAPLLAAAR